ncbi:flagellar protein FlaG [Pseudomonas sp. S31]|uniref:flagellar protein FlaG n=1 Tax=Pseudomonas sp. S31 TaxID=1564473 RepID=UPI001913C16B|nr:flagellar protein FlaG [Pseudomonas sp. S31]MBK5000682.1 flagellar protein FlaG [Pseudomonas sp. S31]
MDINLNVNAASSNLASAAAVGSAQGRPDAGIQPDAGQDASESAIQTLDQAVESLQKLAQSSHRNLDFSIDEGSGQTVVKVVASDTGEVIRQIPSEVALKLAQSLKDADGLLFNDMA